MALLQAYEIPARPEFDIQLPQGAQVISFYNLEDKPYIGVLVDIAARSREPRYFSMVELRATLDTTKLERLVGVAVFRKGQNPLHLFERKRPEVVELKVVGSAA